jgi:hypothetical protein
LVRKKSGPNGAGKEAASTTLHVAGRVNVHPCTVDMTGVGATVGAGEGGTAVGDAGATEGATDGATDGTTAHARISTGSATPMATLATRTASLRAGIGVFPTGR